MEDQRRRKRIKKRKKRGAWPVLFLLLFVLLIVLAMSPVCNVTEVSVEGNERVATETILEAAGEITGRNIFRLSAGRIEKKVESVPYVAHAEVKRRLPGKLLISVTESDLSLFVPCKGQMLAVSRDARVADVIQEENAVSAPIAEGITVTDYEIGKPLQTEQKDALEMALRFTDLLKEYDLFNKVTAITPNPTNLTFTLGYHLTVEFGTEENSSYKMKYLKQVLSEVDESTDGVINIRSVDHVTYRKESHEAPTAAPEDAAPDGEVSTGETPQEGEEATPIPGTEEPTAVPEPE